MSKKKKDEGSKIDRNAWMVTFSDLVTLMITFFVMLLTMSTMDSSRLKEMFRFFPGASMAMEGGAVNMKTPKRAIVPQIRITSRAGQEKWIDEQHEENFYALKRWLIDRKLQDKVKVIQKTDSFEIHLDNDVVFKPGSTELRDNSILPFIGEVSEMLKRQTDARMRIEVVASDTSELQMGDKFESLWELATERAAVLLTRFSGNKGVSRKRLSMIGYGRPDKILDSNEKSFSQRVELVFLRNDPETTPSGDLR